MSKINFRKVAIEATTLSTLMLGREKIKMEELVRKYPGGVTIVAVDKIPDSKTGEMYSLFLFKEDTSVFATGGVVLNKIVDEWLKAYEGDVDMLNHDLHESGGVSVKFRYDRTSNGNNMVYCEVI